MTCATLFLRFELDKKSLLLLDVTLDTCGDDLLSRNNVILVFVFHKPGHSTCAHGGSKGRQKVVVRCWRSFK